MKRCLAVMLAVCLLLTALPMAMIASAATAQTLNFNQLQGYHKTQGRVEVVESTGSLRMDTSSSGFEFYFYGSGDVSMKANIQCSYTTEMFFTVIVDGVKSRVEVDNGVNTPVETTVALASGLSEGYHHIEVYKQTEASSARVEALSVTFTGTVMVAPPTDKIVMEVIGDSISGGASNLTTNEMPSPQASYPVYQEGTQTYAYLTSEALGAELRVVQTSGWGLVDGWNNVNSYTGNMQEQYPYTSYWRDSTSTGLYDFPTPADIVIINLGTNDGTRGTVTDTEFKAGVLNLIDMIQEGNPGAKVVMCTGMMGKYYEAVMTETAAELGGAAAGYFYCALPQGQSGGEAHPNVAEHQAAAETLTAFLLENCLPSTYKVDFATATDLQTVLNAAKAVASPSAALEDAILWAQIELDCGTTDGYRLGCRVKALNDAMNGYVTGLDLMPIDGVTEAPQESGHYVWPYYADTGAVTLYKGGEGLYWPHLHTEYATVVDLDVTPYLTIETSSNTEWNVHIAYLDANGTRRTVAATTAAGETATNFAADATRKTLTIDFASYVAAQSHANSDNHITVVGCDMYVVGEMDTQVTFYTCAFTDNDGHSITGSVAVVDGVVGTVEEGTTAQALIDAMDNAEYLRIVDAQGTPVTGTVGTGMLLQMVMNSEVVDEAVVAVKGDLTGDGAVEMLDARKILLHVLTDTGYTSAQTKAADYNGSGKITSTDARQALLAALAS